MGREQRINELIDNEKFRRNNSMTMSMKKVYGMRTEQLDETEVDDRADCLVQRFNAPGSKPLYCDAVRYLTRAFLEEKTKYAFEHAHTTPAKLFGAIIYRQLCKGGIYPRKCSV